VSWALFGLTCTEFGMCGVGAGVRAWAPVDNTYFHFLSADLGRRFKITAIATQGSPAGAEFVTEYIVQFSEDGRSWRSYTTPTGEAKV